VTSPQHWRPAPPQPHHPQQPPVPHQHDYPPTGSYQQPGPYPQPSPPQQRTGQYPGQDYSPQPMQPYILQQPQINVTVAPTMHQSISAHGRKRMSHGFHLVMTILTGGLWGLLVWLPLALRRRH
jgi:hypothetical protein